MAEVKPVDYYPIEEDDDVELLDVGLCRETQV